MDKESMTHTHTCTYRQQYYSVLDTNKGILPCVTSWMSLGDVMLRKKTIQKDKYCMISLKYGISKD